MNDEKTDKQVGNKPLPKAGGGGKIFLAAAYTTSKLAYPTYSTTGTSALTITTSAGGAVTIFTIGLNPN
jgi:hypothetical protein